MKIGAIDRILLAAIARHWQHLRTAEQLLFGGLFLLALLMDWRALTAGAAPAAQRAVAGACIGHVGFT